jgi:alpha-tubulin suppressor-like RCC1 family protein
MCGATCTDPTSDPQHCGSCNVQCPSGVSCEAGVCGRALFRGSGSAAPCAAKSDGSLYCWGANSDYQGGIGTNNPMSLVSPQLVTALNAPIRYPASTGYATCALLPSGGVSCFGSNNVGETGNGSVSGHDPTAVSASISNVGELSGGGWWCGGSHFCARTADRKVSCWGDEGSCVVGPAATPTPTLVATLTDVAMLASGDAFDCALRGDGTVWCWGDNTNGQLGQGDVLQHIQPVQVQNLTGVSLIGAGLNGACARRTDGLYCWGANGVGQAGTGATNGSPVTLPAKITSLDVVQIAGGQLATCALTAAGDVYCWGVAYELGNGAMGTAQCDCSNTCVSCSPSPTKVPVSNVVELAFGDEFALVRLTNGSLMAWGGNLLKQIGSPQASNPQLMPIAVPGFP